MKEYIIGLSICRCRVQACNEPANYTFTTSVWRKTVNWGPRRRVFASKLVCWCWLSVVSVSDIVFMCQLSSAHYRFLGIAVCGCCWFLVVGCRRQWLLLVFGCRMSPSVVVAGSWLSGVAVDGCCWFLVVGCRRRCLLLVAGCLVSLSMVVARFWLSGVSVGCRCWFLVVGCRCRWSLLVPGSRLSPSVVVDGSLLLGVFVGVVAGI
jgi:hypothetical protein